MQEVKHKRNYNYDIIRVIAISLVVICHSVEMVYFENSNVSVQYNLFYILCHSISRLGVPLFLYLTGTLLLNKKFETNNDIKKFYKHNFLTLIIVCEIWYMCYYLLDMFVFEKTLYFKEFIQIVMFLKPYPLSHAWYLPMIIGIYLTIPFISILVNKYSKAIKYIMYINIFYVFIIPFINVVLELLKVDYQLINAFNMPFGGGCYGIYLLIGYFISQRYDNEKGSKKWNNYLLILIFALTFAFNIFVRYKLNCDSWYNSLTVLVCSYCIYVLSLKIKINSTIVKKWLEKLSVCSFGVYLIHKPIINLLNKLNLINNTSYVLPVKVLLYFLLSLIISYILAIIISKFKPLKKYVLFIK